MRGHEITPQRLLHSPFAQSIEILEDLSFYLGSRFVGHFSKLHTLGARCCGSSGRESYFEAEGEEKLERSRQPDTSGISAFLAAHADSLRHIKLLSFNQRLSPMRQMNQMRTLVLAFMINAINVVVLLDSMSLLTTLVVDHLHFEDTDLLLRKLASMSCLEEVKLRFSRVLPCTRDPRMQESILAFLTGDSMSRLRTIRLSDARIPWLHQSSCFIPLTRDVMQQVERMTTQLSLHSAVFCYMSLSRSSAEDEGFQWHILDDPRFFRRQWSGPQEQSHRVQGSRALEEQVCIHCDKRFSLSVKSLTDS